MRGDKDGFRGLGVGNEGDELPVEGGVVALDLEGEEVLGREGWIGG